MALSIDTDVVSRNIFGLAYASLDAAKQADVTAAAARAKERVSQYAQHVDFGDGTDATGPWDNWGELEAAAILAIQHRLERVEMLRREADRAMRAALDSFVSRAFNSSTTFAAASTPLALRQHIAAAAMRRDKPMPLDPLTIDNAIHSVVNEVWNQTGWKFRRREAQVNIAADATVTFTLGSGESFDSFATRLLYYTDTAHTLRHVDADEMQRVRSQADQTTGRPAYIRTIDKGSTRSFVLHPAPDQAYTLKAEVFISGPEIPDNASDATWLDLFPPEFKPVIRDLAAARVLREDASPVMERVSALMPRMADVDGWLSHDTAPRDVYEDAEHIGPFGRWCGSGDIGGAL